MVLELSPGAASGCRGVVRYRPEFELIKCDPMTPTTSPNPYQAPVVNRRNWSVRGSGWLPQEKGATVGPGNGC